MLRGLEPLRPRVIAALHTEMLADAAGIAAGRTPVRLCADESQLDDCFNGATTPLLLAELGAPKSPMMLSRVMSHKDAPLIGVLPNGVLPLGQIISLALSGTRFELVHDVTELSAAIRLASSFQVMDSEIGEIVRALAWRVDRETLEDVVGLLILGRRRTTVGEALARIDRTAVMRTALRQRALPTPARLLGWGCAFHVIWQMERYGRDLNDVSRALGFESPRHCSDGFKFHTGSAPMNVLRGQGFEGVLDEFLRRVGAGAAKPASTASLKATDYLRISA